jgi:lactate dehydrogenase-like 2-hydroxyacid dehydrogenase
MARILISTPILEGCLDALAAHELRTGEPGSDGAAEGLLCSPTMPVDGGAIARMPVLRVISLAGAGSDAIDRAAADQRGIVIRTAPEALLETTADAAFGLIIWASRQLGETERALREGRWEGWRFDQTWGRDVHGATLGLVGYGAIGNAVGRRAAGFGMNVIHHTRHDTGEPGWRDELDELLAASDIVSVHVPLSDSTRGLIDSRRLALMREGAVLVNTARGAVIEEDALAEALESGHLGGAGLDVYAHEPVVSPRLLAAPRTVLLPHVGSATTATRRAMLRLAAERLAESLR